MKMNYTEKLKYFEELETEEEQLDFINSELNKAGNYEELTLMDWAQFDEALDHYVDIARFGKSFWELHEIVKNIEEEDGAYYYLVGFEDDGEPYIRATYTNDLECVIRMLDWEYIHINDNYYLIEDYIEQNEYEVSASLLDENDLQIYDPEDNTHAIITPEKAEEIAHTDPENYANIELEWTK